MAAKWPGLSQRALVGLNIQRWLLVLSVCKTNYKPSNSPIICSVQCLWWYCQFDKYSTKLLKLHSSDVAYTGQSLWLLSTYNFMGIEKTKPHQKRSLWTTHLSFSNWTSLRQIFVLVCLTLSMLRSQTTNTALAEVKLSRTVLEPREVSSLGPQSPSL